MKKWIAVLSAVIMMGTFATAAFAAPAGFKDRYVITGHQPGSAILVYSSTLSGFLEKSLPEGVKIDIAPTGGTVASCTMVESGKADLGWAETTVLWAYEGKVLYKEPHKKLRSIAGGVQYANAWGFMTGAFADKYGIKTFDDLKAKKPPVRIYTKKRGFLGQAVGPMQLEAYGISYDDIKAWGGNIVETGLSEIVDALRDNRGDLWMDNVPIGHAAATELFQTADMRILLHSEAGIKNMAKYGFFQETIPAGTWKGQTVDVIQPTGVGMLITSSDATDEFIYVVTKAMSENAEAFRKCLAGTARFDEKTAWIPEKTLVPLHPGAIKYYKEVGLMQ